MSDFLKIVRFWCKKTTQKKQQNLLIRQLFHYSNRKQTLKQYFIMKINFVDIPSKTILNSFSSSRLILARTEIECSPTCQ